jgi:hypothetical protein
MTFEERCRLSEQCLPEAPYREMLTKLHNEMLEALAQPEQNTVESWFAASWATKKALGMLEDYEAAHGIKE